ncbi:phosphotransferase [Marinomonas sp. A79]|uniref:Phosphotransferase n=1 Tax=Marinomonas vulgaris TaxID=2823372 RepID=A0ABS5HDF8_9GAMM|nr:phosphotransferase [Marinomonas vulgaris]MBR7889428.1 phosphotransferase [Marinomonas vulgaris]
MTTLSECLAKMSAILPLECTIETTLLDDGFLNNVYLLSWNGAPQWVLRIPYEKSELFHIHRAEELRVLNCAAEQGIAPVVVWQESETGCVVSQFVMQPSLDWSVCHGDSDIIRLAQALVRFHALPAGQHSYSVFDVIKGYLQRIEEGIVENESLKKEYDYLVSMFQQMTLPERLLPSVLCHNDVNPKNVLMDNEHLWLIDYEYAGFGDPLFDLALVAQSHNLDPRQTRLLLSSYGVDFSSGGLLAAIDHYKIAYGMREMAWMLLKSAITPQDNKAFASYLAFKDSPSLNPFLLNKGNA